MSPDRSDEPLPTSSQRQKSTATKSTPMQRERNKKAAHDYRARAKKKAAAKEEEFLLSQAENKKLRAQVKALLAENRALKKTRKQDMF